MFLPKGYEIPKQDSLFMKFQQGANKFRSLTDVTLGYEYWNADGKPVRMKEMPESKPEDLRINDDGTLSAIKHFWAFLVLDREDNEIKLLMVNQTGIMGQINDLLTNPDWGDPKDYDLTVTRKGEKLETKYSVQPSPKKKITKDELKLVEDTDVDIEKLVFGTKKMIKDEEIIEDRVEIEDVSF